MTLSEVCQNIVEHAGRGGWVAVQTYTWRSGSAAASCVIAVCDAGIGFRAVAGERARTRALERPLGRRRRRSRKR